MKVLTLKDFKYLIDNLFKNKTSLDKVSESEEGVLLFDGEEISGCSGGGSGINDLLVSDNNTYSSEKIEERLTEIINTIGVGSGSGTAVVTQKTFLEVAIDDILNINSTGEFDLQNAIVQLYKFIPGTQDIVEIIKDFDNTEKESFYYNPENVEFTGVMRIKDRYPLNFTYNSTEGYYESEVINKSDFVELYGIEVS